jgi:aspartyl-tRNA(Asn)/glutamyl-tRNA(Gln) amidotransferase subunit C
MPEAFSRSQVEAIGSLANLELTEEEIELFTRQLGDILDYANQLQHIDTTGVPPTASVVIRHTSDREDAPTASLERTLALANAPDANLEAGLFKVPRVIG